MMGDKVYKTLGFNVCNNKELNTITYGDGKVMFAFEKNKFCAKCKEFKKSKPSSVRIIGVTRFVMIGESFWDKKGEFITSKSEDYFEVHFECGKGHRWDEQKKPEKIIEE